MGYVLQSELESLFLKYVGAAPLDAIAPFVSASGRINPVLEQLVSRVLRLHHGHLTPTEHRDGIIAELTSLLDEFREQIGVLKAGCPSAGIEGLWDALPPNEGAPYHVDLSTIEKFDFVGATLLLKLTDGTSLSAEEIGDFVRVAEQKIAGPFDVIHRHIFGVFRDIAIFETTRNKAETTRLERRVRAAETRSQGLINTLPIGIVLSGPDGDIRQANVAFRRLHALNEKADLASMGWEALLTDLRLAGENPGPALVHMMTEPGGFEAEMGEGRRLRIENVTLEDGSRLGIWADLSIEAQHARELEQLALADGLTGLPNRMAFLRHLDRGMAEASQGESTMALLLLDLDHFKKVNDTYGHPVGDELLKLTAARLKACLDPTDIVARLGGDEFAVIIPCGDGHSAQIFNKAQRIVATLGEPFDIRSYVIRTGSSVGMTIFPHDPGSPDDLVQNADIALYQAKQAGRGMIALFDRTMRQKHQEKQRMEDDLVTALEREQFSVHYQPQISLDTGEIIGVEALLRWTHPELGVVDPSRFISVAEGSGLIVPITNWVIGQACADVRTWSERGVFCGGVSVNISPVHFGHSDLFGTIRDVLDETRIDPRSLELEITESTIIGERYDPLSILERLKELGVRIAIDDFGMGYSSFNRLKTLPIDRLKVDQSFVTDMVLDAKNQAIAATIVRLGNSLDLNVIAEGVETEEQLCLIKEIGCTEVQGYYISRPLAAAEVAEFLTRHNPSRVMERLRARSAA